MVYRTARNKLHRNIRSVNHKRGRLCDGNLLAVQNFPFHFLSFFEIIFLY